MKKNLLILTLTFAGLSFANAQEQPGNDQPGQKKIEALYVAYVTQQLALTPDEAQKFWPVHTQFATELKSIKAELPELAKEEARLNIKKKYQDNFSRIIGASRCDRFFRMDGEFKRKLSELRNQRQQNQRPRLRRVQ